jgi:hypothetical protein
MSYACSDSAEHGSNRGRRRPEPELPPTPMKPFYFRTYGNEETAAAKREMKPDPFVVNNVALSIFIPPHARYSAIILSSPLFSPDTETTAKQTNGLRRMTHSPLELHKIPI